MSALAPQVSLVRRVRSPFTVSNVVLVPSSMGLATAFFVGVAVATLCPVVGIPRESITVAFQASAGMSGLLAFFTGVAVALSDVAEEVQYFPAGQAAPIITTSAGSGSPSALLEVDLSDHATEDVEEEEEPSTVLELSISPTQTKRLIFGMESSRLTQFASQVLSGRSLSERDWAGSGRAFTVAEYRAMIGEMVSAGLIEWKSSVDPKQGRVLTERGRLVFVELASQEVA